MKKFITSFLAVLALAFIAVSCTDQDDSSNSSTIAGRWYYDTTLTTYNGVENPEALPYNYSHCEGKKSYLEFQPSGVLDEGAIFQDCTLHNYTNSWVLNGEVLNTVLDTGKPMDYDVVELSSTKLVLKNYVTPDKKSFTVYNFTRQ